MPGKTSSFARQKLPTQEPGELREALQVFSVYKADVKAKQRSRDKVEMTLTFTYEPPNVDLLNYQE